MLLAAFHTYRFFAQGAIADVSAVSIVLVAAAGTGHRVAVVGWGGAAGAHYGCTVTKVNPRRTASSLAACFALVYGPLNQ
jgi:hypothetical protein